MKATTFIQSAMLLSLVSSTPTGNAPLRRRACAAKARPAVAAAPLPAVAAPSPSAAPPAAPPAAPAPPPPAAPPAAARPVLEAPAPPPKPVAPEPQNTGMHVPAAPADHQWGGSAGGSSGPTLTLEVSEGAASHSRGALSGGRAMIGSINAYRARAGLPGMEWSERLADNAAKTSALGAGRSMLHKLHDKTNGQVLVFGLGDDDRCGKEFGHYTPFELAYYSWLCEVPGDPALGGKCGDVLGMSNIDSQGQTGHHELLHSSLYPKIGCAFTRDDGAKSCGVHTGIWACDVGF